MLSMDQVNELINGKIKKQNSRVMPVLCDRASNYFTPEMISTNVTRVVKAQTIPDYKGERDPIQHIQKHGSILSGTHKEYLPLVLHPLEGVTSLVTQLKHEVHSTLYERALTPKKHWIPRQRKKLY